jgi:DNA primase
VENAGGFFDYYLNRLCEQNDAATDKGRLVVLHDMAEAVHKTGNNVLVDTYAQKTALRLGVSPEAVRTEFKKVPATQPAPVADEGESFEDAAEVKRARPSPQEFQFLKILLKTDQFIDWAAKHVNPNWITDGIVREIFNRRIKLHETKQWKGVLAFLDEFSEHQEIITEVLTRDLEKTKKNEVRTIYMRNQDSSVELMPDIVLKLRNQFLDQQIAGCVQRASQPGISDSEQLIFSREGQDLRKQKREPLSPLN